MNATALIERIAARLHEHGTEALHLASDADKAFACAEYATHFNHDIELTYSLRDWNDAAALGQTAYEFIAALLFEDVERVIGDDVDNELARLRSRDAHDQHVDQQIDEKLMRGAA